MTTSQPLFTVTLTAAQIEAIRGAAEYALRKQYGADEDLVALLTLPEALDAAKPVRATRPRATTAAVEPFSPNTGDPAVDEFMRRKHNPKYKPLPLPKSPGLPPLRPMKVSEQDAAEAAWKSACDEARAVVASGKPSEAEARLRDLIAIHRNPWRVEATERPDWQTETRILTSSRHPGMAINETTCGHSKTWRVMAADALSERIHYAAAAAEIEADELT